MSTFCNINISTTVCLLSILLFLTFPGGSDGKESAWKAGDLGLIPGLWRSPGERYGYPLQYSRLENSMDRGDWWATVYGVAELDRTEQLKHIAQGKAGIWMYCLLYNICRKKANNIAKNERKATVVYYCKVVIFHVKWYHVIWRWLWWIKDAYCKPLCGH